MLWKVPVTFSPLQNTFFSGNQVCISDGASVKGAFWNSIFTPSTVWTSMAFSMTMVGAIRPRLPAATFWASPWPACP